MGKLFSAKVRNVGTSLGILIPIEVVREEKIKVGKDIEVSILRKNLKLIEESFGIAKGAKVKFERDRGDRLERWENVTR